MTRASGSQSHESASRRNSTIAGPPRSSYSPRLARSETVRMPMRIGDELATDCLPPHRMETNHREDGGLRIEDGGWRMENQPVCINPRSSILDSPFSILKITG